MRILILSQYAGSSRHGMVFRNHVLARAWVAMGHEVTIVASSFAHTRTSQPDMDGRLVKREMVDGVQFCWIWGPTYAQRGRIGRVLSMFVFTVAAFLVRATAASVDVVIASSPSPFAIYPARRIARKHGAKLVYDIRDLWPLTLVELGGYSPKHPFISLMQRTEDYACRLADLVTAVPANSENYLRSHGLRENRFLAIGNTVPEEDLEAEPLPAEHLSLLRRLRDEGAFLIGYAGALGLANAVHAAVSAVARADQRIHLVLVGRGDLEGSLQQLASDLGVSSRVHVLPPVSRRQVREFLDSVDVAYAGTRRTSLFQLGTSLTKLNDYMLAAKPTLYAVGDPGNAIEASGGGICCAAEDVDEIVAAMNALGARPPSELAEMGARARAWRQEHLVASKQAATILSALADQGR